VPRAHLAAPIQFHAFQKQMFDDTGNSQASFLWNCEVRHAISAGILERGFWLLQVGVRGDHMAMNGLREASFCSATLVGRNVGQ